MKTINSAIFACLALIGTSVSAADLNEEIAKKESSELSKTIIIELEISMKESLQSIKKKNKESMSSVIGNTLQNHDLSKEYRLANKKNESYLTSELM
jgi:spore coat protein CotF